MATIYQIEPTIVNPDGTEIPIGIKNNAYDVSVGNLNAGALDLPASDPNETLATTIANIKKFLSNLSNVAAHQRNVSNSLTSSSDIDIATSSAVASLKTSMNAVEATLAQHKTWIDGKAPINHAVAGTTYGQATGSLFGHVKVSDTYASQVANAAAANGIVASQNALFNAYNTLNSGKSPNNHAVNANTYGLGTSGVYGHVKVSDTYTSKETNAAAANSVGASQNALYNAYNTLKGRIDGHDTSISGKAPTSHASTGTGYGVGNGSNYGHVKLSDSFNTDNSGSGAAAHSVAASSWAVYRAYAAALSDATTKVNNHNNARGTAGGFGHVKLTDTYNSNQGAAASAIAPSSKALADCYTALSNSITNLQNSINTLNTQKANASHSHDDRYFTESEVNTKLNGKSNTDHTHDGRYMKSNAFNLKLIEYVHNQDYNGNPYFEWVDSIIDPTKSWAKFYRFGPILACTFSITPYNPIIIGSGSAFVKFKDYTWRPGTPYGFTVYDMYYEPDRSNTYERNNIYHISQGSYYLHIDPLMHEINTSWGAAFAIMFFSNKNII